MNEKLDRELVHAVAILGKQREVLEGAGATFVVYLLDIVLLELRRQLCRISDAELDQFASMTEDRLAAGVGTDLSLSRASSENAVKLRAERNW